MELSRAPAGRPAADRTEDGNVKAFLEEYGVAVFTLACIAILIMIATPVGEAVKNALLELIGNFVKNPGAYQYTPAG